MTAISGTRRQIRELVDGSLEVRIYIDPRFKAEFHRIFPQIDMPVAIAPLVADFERIEQTEKQKGGPLCTLAARWCKDPEFREWLLSSHMTEEEAASYIRDACGVKSRRELDHNPTAAALFNERFRAPYMDRNV